MHHIHPNQARLLHDADLMVSQEARSRHRIQSRPLRRFRTALLHWRHRELGCFDSQWALCKGLSDGDRHRLEGYFQIADVDAGTTLGVQGLRVRNFVLVVSGQVGVSVDGAVVAVLEAGAHFGSLPLLSNDPAPIRYASFLCLAPATVGTVYRPNLRRMIEEIPSVGDQLRATARIRGAYFNGRSDVAEYAVLAPLDRSSV